MTQIATSRRYPEVAAELRQIIQRGGFSVGDKMPAERQLAEQLDVSRALLREALIMLEIQGLVEVRQGSGVYITRLPDDGTPKTDDSDIGPFELMQARQVLESSIAEVAALTVTKADIDALQRILQIQEQEARDGITDYSSDEQFHDVVVYLLENANIPQGGSGAAAPAAGDSSAAAPAAEAKTEAPATEAKTEAPAVADNSAAAPAAEAKTEVAAAGGASAPRDPNFNPQGEYDKLCATCHAIGLMNAPKLGDSAAWKERLDKAGGLDGLVQQGIKGINAMPPKGGSTVNDDQFHDLVVFFLDKSDVAH